MNGSHATGGGFGAMLGVGVVALLNGYAGTHLSDTDSAVIGSTAVALGVGLAHVVSTEGLVPAVRRIIFGKPPNRQEDGDESKKYVVGTSTGAS